MQALADMQDAAKKLKAHISLLELPWSTSDLSRFSPQFDWTFSLEALNQIFR